MTNHGCMATTLKSKPNNRNGNVQGSQYRKKTHQVRSNMMVLLTVFFDCNNVVHHELLQQGRMANKEYYLEVMRQLREGICQKRRELWKNLAWILRMMTHQFTKLCLYVSFWSKTKLQSYLNHGILRFWLRLTFSSSQN